MATAVRNALLSICFALLIGGGRGQGESSLTADPPSCFGAGSIAAAVLLTFLATLLLIGGLLYFLKRRGDARKGNHLILETDPERGEKAEYAFDNPGFKDATLPAATKPDTSNKTKWTHWSSLVALHLKPDKKRAFDDSALQSHEVKVVALKSQDFTGLGFNICGNMKEGIYIKDILHRGPAFESGKLHPGDRINSVTISFEHMVYEDALNILSYASPYEVIVEAKSGRILSFQQGQDQSPVHPIFRSVSSFELTHPKKKLFGDDHSTSSNYSSLQKSRSNVTTLERKESKSPRPNQPKPKKDNKSSPQTPEMLLKSHLDETIAEESLRIEAQPQRSLKALEQNQTNASIDEVDVIKIRPPQAKKREKKSPEPLTFERNDSGIRRDFNGIPLEIPEHMQDVALMAQRNRKSCTENGLEDPAKRAKGKAPSPPAELKTNFTLGGVKSRAFEDLSALGTDSEDDEDEANQMSSVNTIELNSSDVTVHQAQEEERKSRKTASTGDLTKMKRAPKSNSGTLERAQSLDITDTSGPGLSKMRAYDATENLLIDREPRLSLILDGLNTFQRNRLKTSAEWGNLEDAILNVSDEDWGERRKSEPQFNAVMDKVIQIKRESGEIEVLPDELVRKYQINDVDVAPQVMNKLWPDDEEIDATKQTIPPVPERTKLKLSPEQLPQPTERVSKIDVVLENNSAIPSLLNRPDSNLQVEFECLKPIPPKRERTPENETVINLNKFNKVPMVTTFEKNNVSEMCSQMAKDRNGNLDAQLIKDEWEVDQLHNTSPPPSMTLVDEVMDSYNKNYGGTVTVVQTEPTANVPDETKTVGAHLKHLTANFIYNERTSDTNVPDDVKVSRSSFDPQGGSSNLHSLELSINNELYTTALEHNDDVKVIVSSPSSVTVRNTNTPEVEITESTFSKIAPVNEQSDYKVEITESKYTTIEVQEPSATSDIVTYKGIEDESPAISLTDVPEYEKKTYITEIQVMTPATEQNKNTDDPLENAFENYVKNFERKLETFESNMQNFENNLEEFIRDEPTSIVLQEDVEKQASKIQEIAEEQLKTLPEMRFSTSSYESGGRKTPEKRHSFELLRSSFEKASSDKSPQRRDSKSRIPIATTMKTPPTSPERRDSRNLDNEPDKAILELMSSSKIKSPGATKNVSITSIRNNSKLPSGLPTLSARPPIPPRKTDEVSANGGTESSFKQWVFNPNSNVTNVTVGKEK